MEKNRCDCGEPASHRCTNCSPPKLLCRSCISPHIQKFPSETFIPLRQSPAQNGTILCGLCTASSAIYLQVLGSDSIPLCKSCKKGLRNQGDAVIVPIKWKEVVSSSSDLQKIYIRTEAQRLAFEEIEKSFSVQALNSSIVELRDNIIAAAKKYADKKFIDVESAYRFSNETSKSLKKEVEEQILKCKPDINTVGGKLVDSLLTTGVPCSLPSQKLHNIDSTETDEIIQSIFESVKVQASKPNFNVYLFNPGRDTLTRVDVEAMQKQDIIFERNWTFEASWCVLTSGDIFFCGGNGLNNSEVLMIDVLSRKVTPRKNFTGRSGHAIIEIAGFVYVFGGNKGNSADKYSFIEDEWGALADLPGKLQKTSICKEISGVVVTGIDSNSIYLYIIEQNVYRKLGVDLEQYKNKNKMVFSNGNNVYCMCGDKLFYTDNCNNEIWEAWGTKDILDRDWWSYSQPIIYNGCAYFIKYFVRNLWRLNLSTFELKEIYLQDLQVIV